MSNSSSALKARARPKGDREFLVSARPSVHIPARAGLAPEGLQERDAGAREAREARSGNNAHAAPCSAMNATGSDAAHQPAGPAGPPGAVLFGSAPTGSAGRARGRGAAPTAMSAAPTTMRLADARCAGSAGMEREVAAASRSRRARDERAQKPST